MTVKKRIWFVIMIVVLFCAFSVRIFAQEPDFQSQYDELLNASGADKLYSIVPDDAKDILEENNLDKISQDSFVNLSFFDFAASIWKSLKDSLSKPIMMLCTCIGITMLCALLNSMKSSFNNQSYERLFSVVSVICISSAIIVPIANIIIRTGGVIKQVSNFLLSFVPVYVGIITASGKPISAAAYSTALIALVQVISRICATVLVPLLGMYMAFCLIGSASNEINVGGIAKTVKTFVITILTFLLTIFVGLLTIQGVVANSADTLTLKTAKFAVSAFVPVVGSAISEALNSVQGCVGVIKSTVGGFGIFAVTATFIPSVISVLLMQLSLAVAGGVSDMLGTDKITGLMKGAQAVLSLILGILLTFAVMLIVSLGLMLTISAGGA